MLLGLSTVPGNAEMSFLERKTHFVKGSDYEQRLSHSRVWVCCHPCFTGMLWTGGRKEARSLRSVEMPGVLWLLREELPENLRPSPSW